MNDLIEKMKKNEKPLGLLNEEEQAYLQEHGKHVQFYYLGKWNKGKAGYQIDKDYACRISPDYTPETEIEKCGVFEDDGKLYFYHKSNEGDLLQYFISEAVNFADFYRFKYADGSLLLEPVKRHHGKVIHPTHVLFKKED